MKKLILVLAAVSSLWGAAAAHAQTVIDSLPYTITANGTYVLNGNLNSSQTSGNLISINASNVTIDFQGHYIAGAVNNTSQTTVGISASERSNLTIKNGTIAYCSIGILIGGDGSATTNSVDHQIDNMRVTYCYYVGIYLSNNPATRVTNCQVSQGGFTGANGAYGIAAIGAGATIEGNVVSSITGTPSTGILAGTGSFVRQNTVSNATTGVSGGKYQDNLTANCTTTYTGGIDAGGNN